MDLCFLTIEMYGMCSGLEKKIKDKAPRKWNDVNNEMHNIDARRWF